MKLRLYHYLELTGLIIVLLSTTFQLTLLAKVNDISNQGAFLRIEEKINMIWFEMTNAPKNSDLHDSREQYFNYWTGSGDRVDKQKDWLSTTYTIVMLIGSTLLVLGRWLEIKADQRASSPVKR